VTPEATAVVRAALRDPDGSVRSRAVALLADRAPEETTPIALALYRSDPSPGVRAAALNMYGRLAGDAAIPTLTEATTAGHPEDVRATAAFALGRTHDPMVLDALARLTDPTEARGLRQAALMSIASVGDTARTIALTSHALTDYDPLFATAAVQVLGRLGTPEARAALETAERSETRVHVKAAIERALQRAQ
jgi:HEAT repeat protein